MKLSLETAALATGAVVINAGRAPDAMRIMTDTRSLQPGDAFLALRGERFDGHAFLAEAKAKGAAAFIVEDASAVADVAALIVPDTLKAYMALAGAAREAFTGRVLAITGSAGKTTTKVFSAQLLATRYGERVLASPANENNEIGVSKLLLAASNDAHDVLVVEMGARHFGDIAPLVAIAKPGVAILTNIGDAHLEIMGSRERLEATKWAIFESGARAILNERDDASRERAAALAGQPHWFYAGSAGENVPARGRLTALQGRDWLVHRYDGVVRERAVSVTVPGDHNRANLAAAAAAALELDADFAQVADAMEHIVLPKGRYETIEVGGVRLIYDAYNANASGTIAALDAFAAEPAKRRIALLSSMAELGDEAPQLHRRVGAHTAETHVDVALFGGDYADELALGAKSGGLPSERIVRFGTNTEAAEWLRTHACEGDAVLLKGSRKYKLEEIVEELRG